MKLQVLLLPSLFLFSFHIPVPCFSNSDRDPSSSLYRIRAYPTYYGQLDGEESVISGNLYRTITQSISKVDVSASAVVNVLNYGAKGDGSDDTKPFLDAWSEVCSSPSPSIMMVPANKNYLLKPITFNGPCKSKVSVMIEGMIHASTDRSDWDEKNLWHWILFQGINNLWVGGGGVINGNGQIWWKNSCKINKSLPCKIAPTAITFYACNNLMVENLRLINGQQIHLQFENCNYVKAFSLTIRAPGNSPNTDGIHIAFTQNIHLDHCDIGTGDDCISIVTGSKAVNGTNITCGPGHGISIGSLGAQHSEDYVSDVLFDTAHLKGSTNGLRIKTWQGGSGQAKRIRFQNVDMNNVPNPIIIDQNYCDSTAPCQEQISAVQISNVVYKNIRGTSASDVAINFECSKNFPCQGIELQNIKLVKAGGGATKSVCHNIKLINKGNVIPSPCAYEQ